jgi:RNA polymerase sigma-70 factor (ECF subfamily)
MDRDRQRTRDGWLALRCQLGEEGAFGELVREFERPLRYFVTKLLGDEERALDVLQEVWLRALRGLRKLDDHAALRPWLYRLAHGIAVDRLRRESARDRIEGAPLPENGVAGPEPEPSIEDAVQLHQRLGALELKHREVLVLHFLESLSVAEVAEILGCPVGTVKSRLHHAKRALADALRRTNHA